MSSFNPLAHSNPTGSMGRRRFLGATLAAVAALPGRALWADATDPKAIPDNLTGVGSTGKPVTLNASDIKDLRASLTGQLLLAQERGYDQARRVWNGAFDRNPALIVRCGSTADVVRAVNFARSHALLTAVKSGGHGLSGLSTCEGGLMIDLSLLKGIQVDRAHRTATAQSGVLLAELDLKAQAAGLVTPLGTAADTGIAGLTLGGGQGRLMRALGLSCDNVRAFEIVTADGQTLQVDEQQNPDLFWGLRGGGGNFGVVTRFDYRLHPLGHPVLAGGKVYPFSQVRSVLAAAADLAQRAPNELYLSAGINNVAPGGSLPAGRYVALEVLYAGKLREGEALLAPLAKLGKPLVDTVVPKPYVAAQNGATEASPPALPPGLGVYIKSGFIEVMSEAVIGEMIHAFDHGPEWLDGIGLGTLGGAVAGVKPTATAYWNREANWELILDGAWSDHSQDQNNAAVLRDLWKAFEPYTKGYYVNTEPSADERRLRATYGDNYARLVQLKDRYDPGNFFRLNANIKPTLRT